MTGPFRNELKFVIRLDKKIVLLERWRRYLTKDSHTNEDAVSPVLSQYYDSPDLAFYREKIDGVGLRDKVRLRTYGYRFEPGRPAFLEIKNRQWDRVRKWRQKLDEFCPGDFDPANWRFDGPGEQSVFGELYERRRLRKSAQIFYLREAYQSDVEPDVRITFDSALMALHPGEALTRDALSDPSRKLLPDALLVLEIKATRQIPHWAVDGALSMELIQRPVPKYIMGVEKLRLQKYPPTGAHV